MEEAASSAPALDGHQLAAPAVQATGLTRGERALFRLVALSFLALFACLWTALMMLVYLPQYEPANADFSAWFLNAIALVAAGFYLAALVQLAWLPFCQVRWSARAWLATLLALGCLAVPAIFVLRNLTSSATQAVAIEVTQVDAQFGADANTLLRARDQARVVTAAH